MLKLSQNSKITEISETEVKIKYITETGRGFYKKIVNLSDIEEVK